MRRKVFLHGTLKSIHDGPIEVVADTVAQVIKIVSLQLPGFQPNAITGYRRIQVAGCDTLDELMADWPHEEIHIFPQFNGAKSGGLMEVLIGVALVAASFLTAGTALAFLGPMLLSAGFSLVLGGILQFLQAPQRASSTAKSHYLGSPSNTTEIGTVIPILYGRRKIGGQYLSVNLSATRVAVG